MQRIEYMSKGASKSQGRIETKCTDCSANFATQADQEMKDVSVKGVSDHPPGDAQEISMESTRLHK